MATVNSCRVVSVTEDLSRDERRQRSEAAILEAAEYLFAETGYERTTIRTVAARAGVDPALVMQHFGSKEGLFAAAARWPTDHSRVLAASAEDLPRAALADMLGRFEDERDREATAALMRSCLTHPTATAVMRDEVMCERTAAVEALISGDDVQLRAALFGACMMGLGMARYLIELPGLAGASREDVVRVMEPVLRQLVDPA